MIHKFYHLLMVMQPKDYMFSPTVLNLGTALSVLKGKFSALICMVKLLKMEESCFPSVSLGCTFLVKLIFVTSCSNKQHLPTNTFFWCHEFGFSDPALECVTITEFYLGN